jgi:menaquinone-specific isochorismate synthase
VPGRSAFPRRIARGVPNPTPRLIRRMHSPSVFVPAGVGLRCREREIPLLDPARFLAEAGGAVRGFWGRGERWVAWAGELGRIQVCTGAAGPVDPGRFEAVREGARRLLGGDRASWAALPAARRPRFFGGFAFLGPGIADPAWEGFPAACFVLPRMVLEGRPDGCRLRVQELDDRGGASGGASRGPDEELERLAGALAGPSNVPDAGGPPASPDQPEAPFRAASAVERERWDGAVGAVLGGVGEGIVRKVVLSRILDARLPVSPDPLAILRFLRRENPRAHVFLFELQPGRIFFGAAPEILAELRDGRFQATAVAGSAPRGATPVEDRDLARGLRESAKDRSEHLLTVEEMAEVLEPRLSGMETEEEPRVLRLARIQHLETVIRGRAGEGEDVLSLVEALHPTPAVCGRPRRAALDLIRGAEPFDRGWYSGPVGWFDPAGDGDFVPALRSAVGGGTRWRLFAGAGIVAGSDPDSEWDETALKFEPALRALAAGVASGAPGPASGAAPRAWPSERSASGSSSPR